MGVIKPAAKSVAEFSRLAMNGSLRLEKDRLGKLYRIEGKGEYEVFRETMSTEKVNQKPVVLVVGFRLKVLRSNQLLHWLFQRVCIFTTPFWSGFTGFHIKLWMVDPRSKNYLGIYDWYGKSNAANYVNTLEKVLAPLSVPGSVWHQIIKGKPFEQYLHTKR